MSMTEDAYEPTEADVHWLHGNNQKPQRWQFVNLAAPELELPPKPPEIHGLLYAGKRHVLSGPPESAKTLIAYLLLLEAMRAGHVVAIIDFEMGAYAARRMLTDLGATQQELRDILYVEPDGPPTTDDLAAITSQGTGYTLIDAAAGAYDVSGLDDNHRKDVERFARMWIRPLFQADCSTITVDHVAKNADTRGNWAIGSERKAGAADIHLGLEAIKTLTRGTTGLVKVTVRKDRPGFLERPTACYFELQSDPDTHHVAWHIRPHDKPDETGSLRPTILMERVSEYLERQHEPVSRNTVELEVKGTAAEWKRKAIDRLILEGYATEQTGPRRSRLVTLTRPYRQATDPHIATSSDFVGTSSGRSDLTSSDEVPPQGASTKSDALSETTSSEKPDEDNHQSFTDDPELMAAIYDDDLPF